MNIPANKNNYKKSLAIFLTFNIISFSLFTLSFGKSYSPSSASPNKKGINPSALSTPTINHSTITHLREPNNAKSTTTPPLPDLNQTHT